MIVESEVRPGDDRLIAVTATALAVLVVVAALRPLPAMSGEVAPQPVDRDIVMRHLEAKVAADPEDFVGLAMLADLYLARHRETSDPRFVELAGRAARASLEILPDRRNTRALDALIHVEMANHEFAVARVHAERLVSLRPDAAAPVSTLVDVLMEIGDYRGAAAQLERAAALGGDRGELDIRRARLAIVHGDVQTARERISDARAHLAATRRAETEVLAWCDWQRGEIELSAGDYPAAEMAYRSALALLPSYPRGLVGLARARTAQGDHAEAIALYERAVTIAAEPSTLSALSDLYGLVGRPAEAASTRELVERIFEMSGGVSGAHARTMARDYADHGRMPELAYAAAKHAIETRRDVVGWDTLAWAALAVGQSDEAARAIRRALELGTKDAQLHYHAGMIARARGDDLRAQLELARALELSPAFDPIHAPLARRALEALEAKSAEDSGEGS